MTASELSVAKRIAAKTRQEIPADLLQVSGRALLSPASTLVSGSPFYFLGINPGEARNVLYPGTVEDDLCSMESGNITGHAHLDERWKSYSPSQEFVEPGQAPIQRRAKQLFAILASGTLEEGASLLRIMPTSNFVLQRSPNIKVLEQRTGTKVSLVARQYWAFHQAVIRETQCKAVIAHAVGLACQLARALDWGEGRQRPSGWGGTLDTCLAWELPEGPMLLALPSLSRYIPDGPRESKLTAFFQEFVSS